MVEIVVNPITPSDRDRWGRADPPRPAVLGPAISLEFVAGMNQSARDIGILHGEIPYDRGRRDLLRAAVA